MRWFNRQAPWKKGAVFLVPAVVGVILTAAAVAGERLKLSLTLATLTGVLFGGFSKVYGDWALSQEANRTAWRLREEAGTALGVLAASGAALILRTASSDNSSAIATVGVSLAVMAFIPVAHAVRKVVAGRQADPTTPAPPTVTGGPADVVSVEFATGQLLNLVLITVTVVPGLLIVGTTIWVAAAAALAWWAAGLLDRLSRRAWFDHVARVAAVVAVIVAVYVAVVPIKDRTLTGLALLIGLPLIALGGLVSIVSGPIRSRQRSSPDFPDVTREAKPLWKLRPSGRQWTVIGIAAIVALAAAARLWVRLGGASGPAKIAVIVACVGLGASFITRGEGFVIAALLSAVVVWTVSDRTANQPLDPHPEAAGRIVALGDSYAAGEGAESFFPGTNISGGNNCRRSPTAYAYLVADRLGKGLDFYACSAAKSKHLKEVGQIGNGSTSTIVGRQPQVDNVPGTGTELLLVTIGGNDALFGSVGKGCVLPGSCKDLENTFTGNLAGVETAVVKALVAVRDHYPTVPIVLVPYPLMLFDDEDGCASAPLDSREFPFIRGFVIALNTTVAAAVDKANHQLEDRSPPRLPVKFFADGQAAYEGHELCNPAAPEQDPSINVINLAPTEGASLAERLLPSNWTHNSFHPTETGHRLMANKLEQWLNAEIPTLTGTAPGPTVTAAKPAIDEVVDSGAGAGDVPITSECPGGPEVCEDKVGRWMAATIADAFKGAFIPAAVLFAAGWVIYGAFVWSRFERQSQKAVNAKVASQNSPATATP
ncbi:MAG: SGNH/GDSL hydrolase family protein [Acidimicrobiales bacterium]